MDQLLKHLIDPLLHAGLKLVEIGDWNLAQLVSLQSIIDRVYVIPRGVESNGAQLTFRA